MTDWSFVTSFCFRYVSGLGGQPGQLVGGPLPLGQREDSVAVLADLPRQTLDLFPGLAGDRQGSVGIQEQPPNEEKSPDRRAAPFQDQKPPDPGVGEEELEARLGFVKGVKVAVILADRRVDLGGRDFPRR